ncbi:putative LPS assembly protein LptD, partial [Aphanothece microscopica]|uniref:putative LPS assembly protein LptD n=1 Tax=Aphanothece microscopica TaxID=1049561 RepID=UPI003CE59416
MTRTSFSDPGVTRENGVIEHRPSITVTPKLGPLTIAPTLSYSENWNFQQYTERVDPTDSSIVRSRSQGFFRDYTYSAGVNISTFLYGMLKPDILGIKAFRHTLQPTISVRYQPDQSTVEGGSYGRYVSPVSGQTITYARFNNVLASRQEQLALGYSLLNRFAIKMADDDTSEAKPIELLTVDVSGNYNFAA